MWNLLAGILNRPASGGEDEVLAGLEDEWKAAGEREKVFWKVARWEEVAGKKAEREPRQRREEVRDRKINFGEAITVPAADARSIARCKSRSLEKKAAKK